MCWRRVRLMWSSIDASVVVLPEPVAPVTSTRPRRSSASRVTPGGRPSFAKFGISLGMMRKANDVAPRWRKPLTRNRGSEGCEKAMSRSPVSSNRSRRLGEICVTSSSTDLEVRLRQRGRTLHLLEVTVESKNRRLPELQVDVAGAALDGAREKVDEIDHVRRASASGGTSFTPVALSRF